MRNSRAIVGLCVTLGLLSAGCLSLGQTQSAQVIPQGTVQHQVGVEWYRVDSDTDDYPLPFALPFYALRAGVAERVDLGFRTNAIFTNLGIDLKLQAVDGEVFDLAVDPTLQYAWVWGWAHLPVIASINAGDRVRITFSGRVAYAFPLLDDVDDSDLEAAFGTSSQVAVGGGVSLYLQVGRSFAIVPEVQAIQGTGDTDPLLLSFTLGFTFGSQPDADREPVEPLPPQGPAPTYQAPPPHAPAPHPQPAPAQNGGPPSGVAPEVPSGYGPDGPLDDKEEDGGDTTPDSDSPGSESPGTPSETESQGGQRPIMIPPSTDG